MTTPQTVLTSLLIAKRLSLLGWEIRTPRLIAKQIGRAHVCTPVTNAQLVCRLLLEKQADLPAQDAIEPKQPHTRNQRGHAVVSSRPCNRTALQTFIRAVQR